MSFSRRLVLAAAICCGSVSPSADGADDKPPLDGAAVDPIVAHFAKNGVRLEKEKAGDWWVVTDPKGDGYDVIVAWRTFPALATEAEMRAELKPINLAFVLNAPARVGMSLPGLRATGPTRKPPNLNQVPAVAKLQKLFGEYRPPEPKK